MSGRPLCWPAAERSSGNTIDDALVFEEAAGLVPLELIKEGASVVGARLTAPQPLSRGPDIAAELIASGLLACRR